MEILVTLERKMFFEQRVHDDRSGAGVFHSFDIVQAFA
jgi:hypothetical protein